eukprot:scaffold8628_cov111-Isochrysis_galbana.AAC.7
MMNGSPERRSQHVPALRPAVRALLIWTDGYQLYKSDMLHGPYLPALRLAWPHVYWRHCSQHRPA